MVKEKAKESAMRKKISPGGTPKEDPAHTRDRLLEAGLEVFGEHGYGAATTRMLAERARVNPANPLPLRRQGGALPGGGDTDRRAGAAKDRSAPRRRLYPGPIFRRRME